MLRDRTSDLMSENEELRQRLGLDTLVRKEKVKGGFGCGIRRAAVSVQRIVLSPCGSRLAERLNSSSRVCVGAGVGVQSERFGFVERVF